MKKLYTSPHTWSGVLICEECGLQSDIRFHFFTRLPEPVWPTYTHVCPQCHTRLIIHADELSVQEGLLNHLLCLLPHFLPLLYRSRLWGYMDYLDPILTRFFPDHSAEYWEYLCDNPGPEWTDPTVPPWIQRLQSAP